MRRNFTMLRASQIENIKYRQLINIPQFNAGGSGSGKSKIPCGKPLIQVILT